MLGRLTAGVLGADEDVGGLGQPLHELGDALRVVLGLTQRAHHGAQHPTHDFCEELRVQRLSGTGSVGGIGGWSCSTAGSGRGRRWREDGLLFHEERDKDRYRGVVIIIAPLDGRCRRPTDS